MGITEFGCGCVWLQVSFVLVPYYLTKRTGLKIDL